MDHCFSAVRVEARDVLRKKERNTSPPMDLNVGPGA